MPEFSMPTGRAVSNHGPMGPLENKSVPAAARAAALLADANDNSLKRWLRALVEGEVDEPGTGAVRKAALKKLIGKVLGGALSALDSGNLNSGGDVKQVYPINVNGQTFIFDPSKESIEDFVARIQMLPMWSADP